jgi:ankyrin repeat protein
MHSCISLFELIAHLAISKLYACIWPCPFIGSCTSITNVKFLFCCRGGNVDCRTKKGCSPFFLACKEGHLEIARSLYENSADIEVLLSGVLSLHVF